MAKTQSIDEEFQTVCKELDSNEEHIQCLKCTQSHAMELGQIFCVVCGCPPTIDEPVVCEKRKPRVPRKIPGRDQKQEEVENFEEINTRLKSMQLEECKDSDQQSVAVPETSSHNSGNESYLTENAPEQVDGNVQTEASGNSFNMWTNYHEFGLRICENGHCFPSGDGQCTFCGGFPVDESSEFQTSMTDFDVDDEDYTFWEDKGDEEDREEFGLLICRYGHVFHKSLIVCNICGMQSKAPPRNANKGIPENDSKKVEDKKLTLGNFYVKEPVFSSKGFLPSYSTGKNKGAQLEDLLSRNRKQRIPQDVPPAPVKKSDATCSIGCQKVRDMKIDAGIVENSSADMEICPPKRSDQLEQINENS